MTYPNTKIEVLSGSGAETVDISSQYTRTSFTVVGLSTGILTVRVKPIGAIEFEKLINGEVNLDFHRTLTISNNQLESLEFTVTPEAAYTVKITQTMPVEASAR